MVRGDIASVERKKKAASEETAQLVFYAADFILFFIAFICLFAFKFPRSGLVQLLIEHDFKLLPDASCVISITVDENRWGNLVKGRGRELDRKSDLLNFHHMQSEFLEVSKNYCLSNKIQHIQFNNNQDTLAAAAEALYLDLKKYGVIK